MFSEGSIDDFFEKKLAYPYEYLNLKIFPQPLKIEKKKQKRLTLNETYSNEKDIERTGEYTSEI